MHRGDASKQKAEASPPVKVVGFHVEGASPSPRTSVLSETVGSSGASLSPVIIPPSFQVRVWGMAMAPGGTRPRL